MTRSSRRDGLSPRASELLVYLRERQLCPSFAEMERALRTRSRRTLTALVEELEKRGFIRRLPRRTRAIEVVRPPQLHVVYGPQHFELRAADKRVLWANEDRKAIVERGG